MRTPTSSLAEAIRQGRGGKGLDGRRSRSARRSAPPSARHSRRARLWWRRWSPILAVGLVIAAAFAAAVTRLL